MSEEKQYMLLFSLGPVQTFIAQARKTRDLWLGSFLLSMLMEAAMDGIKSESTLIFPEKPYIEGNIPDLPNKYIALFDTLKQAEDRAKLSKENIRTCWNSIREDIWGNIIKPYIKENDLHSVLSTWTRQTNPDTFFEIFWVIAEKGPHNYKEWLSNAQNALDARKQLRHVKILETPDKELGAFVEPGEKSTISGEREALHGKATSSVSVRAFWAELAQKLWKNGFKHEINPDGEERLDAIDTVKRFAHYSGILRKKVQDVGFPSTSSVTTATFVEAVLQNDRAMAGLENWLHLIQKQNMDVMQPKTIPLLQMIALQHARSDGLLRCDGDLYFAETFTSKRLHEDYNLAEVQAHNVASQGRSALKTFLSTTDDIGIPRPTPYYAFIQMDGDKMGTILGDVTGEEEHRAISGALSTFSRATVPSLVQEQYPGRLVYAGGDDVVALAPLTRNETSESSAIKTILNLVNQLQERYRKAVSDQVLNEENKKLVTASVGIAIAHHLTSLSYVRRAAKQAEDSAKKQYGRNALVVTVLRRSGEQTRVGCQWHYNKLSKEGQPIPLFTEFYELFKQDVLSPKCVYTLLEEAPVLITLETDAQASEIRRVLLRQRSDEKQLPNDRVQNLAKWLVALAEAIDKDDKQFQGEGRERAVELHAEGRRYGLVEVLGWLLVMVFLARKELD